MTTTTIRVPKAVQIKLNELAKQEGKPIGHLLESLIEEHQRRVIVERLKADFRRLRADPEEWASYQDEITAWDGTLLDGLEDE